jgi:hypothetical protein
VRAADATAPTPQSLHAYASGALHSHGGAPARPDGELSAPCVCGCDETPPGRLAASSFGAALVPATAALHLPRAAYPPTAPAAARTRLGAPNDPVPGTPDGSPRLLRSVNPLAPPLRRWNQQGSLDYLYGDVWLASVGVEAPLGHLLERPGLDILVPGLGLDFRYAGHGRRAAVREGGLVGWAPGSVLNACSAPQRRCSSRAR